MASSARKSSPRVEVAGISVSHPERVIDTLSDATKLDVARFYADIGPRLLEQLNDRPLGIVRTPDGLEGPHIFQRHAGRLRIPELHQLDPALDPEHEPLMEIDSCPALVGAVQMGVLEFHTWNACYDRIEQPDRMVFDLDPDPALPWASMLQATRRTLDLLGELELRAYLNTSGGKGMHVVVPLQRRDDWEQVRAFARALSERLAERHPDELVARMGPKNRVGRIFVDYLRNQRGASTVAAYSLRARPGLPVSVPIALAELDGLESASQWTLGNLRERLAGLHDDPWSGYANDQLLTAAMRRTLGLEP
jgi:bifunctional non-homologous end joining protein LigD